jgi:hypothetical protein
VGRLSNGRIDLKTAAPNDWQSAVEVVLVWDRDE